MKRVELKKRIKEALTRRNGYAPNSGQIDIRWTVGNKAVFSVGGVVYGFDKAGVWVIERIDIGKED